jgi:2'-hydroxyisoflavone reductase
MTTNENDFNRRVFLKKLAIATSAAVLPYTPALSLTDTPAQKVDIEFYKDASVKEAGKKLKILVLGGTGFIGPPMVQYAIERGHDVTLLNRGITNTHLFKKLHKIKADRLKGLADVRHQLDREWDVVIDTWQLNPLAIKESTEIFSKRAKQYIYVSSIAVYGRQNYDTHPEIFENLALPPVDAMPSSLSVTVDDYRTRKQLGEGEVQKNFPGNFSITRYHNIVGYYMAPESEGQMYWPVRFQRGGNILLPGDGFDNMQTIDVKDAARWLVKCAEDKITGICNAGRRYAWYEYAGACRACSDQNCKSFWTPLEKLQEQKVSVNTDMPYYIPRIWGPGFFNISDDRAVSLGISYRPLTSTLRDVIDGFYAHYPKNYQFGPPHCNAGISEEREKQVLQALGKV